jgi:predicted O-methyltransferase YrrM
MQELKEQIERLLNKDPALPARILMGRFCFLADNSQFAQSCADPRHFPFFYHLGKLTSPIRLLEIGFGLGLASGCFLQGCKTVEQFTAYQDTRDQFYSYRLGRRNIFSIYKNKFLFYNNIIDLGAGEFDLVLVTEESPLDQYRTELDAAWEHLVYGGLMVIDHAKYGIGICSRVLSDFCKIVNREAVVVNTRYGTALIRK